MKGTDLDDVDWAIVRQLQQDGRRPYGQIAKAVGLTEAPTRQRAARLLEAGAIEIVAIVNPLVLGLRLRAAVGMQTTGDLTAIAARLAAIEEVDWLVATAGSFDLVGEMRCRDEQHLLMLANERIRAVAGVVTAEILVYLDLYKASYSWPPGSGIPPPQSPGPGLAAPAPVLDAVDQTIVAMLKADGRQAFGRIAATVQMSINTVSQRVARLIASDAIRIVAIISPRVRGFRARAAVGLRCSGNLDTVAALLVPVEEIESLYAVAGRYDLLAEIQCADGEHLARTLALRVRAAGPVRSTDVLPFLEIFKVRYPWPPATLPAGYARLQPGGSAPGA